MQVLSNRSQAEGSDDLYLQFIQSYINYIYKNIANNPEICYKIVTYLVRKHKTKYNRIFLIFRNKDRRQIKTIVTNLESSLKTLARGDQYLLKSSDSRVNSFLNLSLVEISRTELTLELVRIRLLFEQLFLLVTSLK